jgi:hypothetical protein
VRKYNGKIVGILGTVIVHLIAAIIFMSFQLQGLKTKAKKIEKFEIEFAAIEEKKVIEKPVKLPPTSIENVLHDDAEMLNIARNLSSKSDEKIDAKDYIDKVKEELIQSGKLGTDNYLDAPRGNSQMTENDQFTLENQKDKEKEKQDDKAKEAERMAANYKGPTRIYYPIPIYKCQGSGKVVLIIEVDQKGIVENASIMEGESTAKDECLIETAVGTALVSRFESDLNAPRIQKGTLTYIFVAQ